MYGVRTVSADQLSVLSVVTIIPPLLHRPRDRYDLVLDTTHTHTHTHTNSHAHTTTSATATTITQAVKIPMGAFSYDWSGFTGACNTKDPARGLDKQHYCCPASGLTPSKPEVCAGPK